MPFQTLNLQIGVLGFMSKKKENMDEYSLRNNPKDPNNNPRVENQVLNHDENMNTFSQYFLKCQF